MKQFSHTLNTGQTKLEHMSKPVHTQSVNHTSAEVHTKL